jgi:putative lipoprotein
MPTDERLSRAAAQSMAAALLLVLAASAASAQSVRGTATYRERIAMPAGAVFEATLEDVSRADAPADVIGRARVTSPSTPPIAFEIPSPAARRGR